MKNNLDKYISTVPDICHGQPCFTGTRIMVWIVLELLEAGQTPQKIKKSYPSITEKHIQAALHYAAEYIKNREFVSIGNR